MHLPSNFKCDDVPMWFGQIIEWFNEGRITDLDIHNIMQWLQLNLDVICYSTEVLEEFL